MTTLLELLERHDFAKIRDWIDPAVFHIFEAPVDDQQLERLLSKEQDGKPTDVGMRAVDAETRELVGVIHAVIVRRNDFAHIQQLVVDPEKCNRGYGVAILETFLNYCFAKYKLHRIQLFTDESNQSAIACCRKVGFHLDGRMRELVKADSGYMDEFVFSILRDEWDGRGTEV